VLPKSSAPPNLCEAFANNPASARVLEKAGFTFEGCLKNDVLKDGKLLDSLLYVRTT
jgi:RimJ/RimL family protein N-acetyltransferase